MTQARDADYIGHAVVDGEIRFFSVSSLKLGDPSTGEGCPRKWRIRYVDGVKEEQKKYQEDGLRYHDETAHYLTTGEKLVSPIVSRGLHILPEPGPDLIVEQEISGKPKLSQPRLFADGIPLIGKIDLCHRRGVNVGGADIEDTLDPPNTVEVADHKFVKNFDRNLTPLELPRDIQMAGYGQLACNVWPETEHVRLSHHYFNKTKNVPAIKVTTRIRREEIATQWEQVDGLARLLRDVARWKGETNQVQANTRACSAYGGCAYGKARLCTAYTEHSLSQMFGTAGIALLNPKEKQQMEIPQFGATAPLPAPGYVDPAVAAAQAQFAAQLAAAQGTPPAAPAPTIPQGFAEAAALLVQLGGTPPLNGEAAAAWAALNGHIVPPGGTTYPATGQWTTFPSNPCSTAADFIRLARDIKAMSDKTAADQAAAAQVPASAPALVSPQTPASVPALASTPLPVAAPAPTLAPAPVQMPAPVVTNNVAIPGALPFAAPAQAPAPQYTPPPPQPEAPKKTRAKKAPAAAAPVPGFTPEQIEGLVEAIADRVVAKLGNALIGGE